MNARLWRTAAVGGIGIVMAAGVVLTPVAAGAAASAPPWEPDSNATGTISFYNSTGHQISGGAITDAPFAAYAVGSAQLRAGDTQALLEFATPNPQVGDSQNWTVAGLSSFPTTYPVTGTGTPSSISSLDASHPVYQGLSDDTTLQNDIASQPNTGPSGDSFDGVAGCAYASKASGCTTTAYENLYQIRMVTSNGSSNTIAFNDADILVNGATGTWTQVYPAPPVAANTTTTTLTAVPTSPVKVGTSVTLTATVAASDSSMQAGTVTFESDGSSLAAPVDVSTTTGMASLLTKKIAPGSHKLTAVFSPTDTADYSGSTSPARSFVVNPTASRPTITGTAQVGKTLTCNEPTLLGESSAFEWKLSSKKAATGRTYALPGSAVGKSVTCTATLTVKGGTPSSATSAAKKVAKGAKLKATKKPKLAGKDKVGSAERVSHGTWSPKASSYSYQWYLGGSKIKGATKASFKLVSKDAGKKVACKVTAKKTGYGSGTAESAAVKVKKS